MEKNFWQKYRDRGLVVMGVNAQERGNPAVLARQFVTRHGVTYPTLMDTEEEMTNTYRIEAFPTIALLDRKGNLRYLKSGYDEESLTPLVEALLEETPRAQ
jgi:peroxiredoxin